MKYSKSQRKTRKTTRNSRRSQRGSKSGDIESQQKSVAGVPRPSGGESIRPIYNPTWNPQYLKVARRMMYSVPAANVASPYIQDPSVGCATSSLNFNTGAINFRVEDVYNVSEFGSLFDQYRIAGVKAEFHYITSSQATLTTTVSNQQVCDLALYEDYDDSTSPGASIAGWNAMLETGRARVAKFPGRNNVMIYKLNPKYLTVEVDNSAGTTGRGTGDGWLDGSTSPGVVWRGLKWAAMANPGSENIVHSFRIYLTYYLCFRQRQ